MTELLVLWTSTAQEVPAHDSFEWYVELTIGVGDWLDAINNLY
ncbi:hypothetical protein [Paenibacillus sp. Soil766]|nr:hypothetical protein [Paenibacillus sp. Soil766]